ncbi:MFS transporter [Thermaerobacter subterraneus]|uniref:MFS transporter n=1 Tax=Thermaerobacter subterraneus TaxID=175696 RepID=UPI0014614508|nr:MFS transporter [Thermaerobacter subterraneus]
MAGLGSGLYAPSTRGAIGSLTPSPLRTYAVSLRAVAANLGMATAPLAFLVLAAVDVDLVFLVSAGLFAALATHRALPELPAQASVSLLTILKEVARDRQWLAFGALIALAWSLYGHLDSNVMVWANERAGLGGMTAVAAGYAVLVAVLQMPVTRYVATRLRHWDVLTAGTALTAAGLLAVGMARSPVGAAVAVTLFALGATLLVPGADLVTSDVAPPKRVNTYFGAAGLFSTLARPTARPWALPC